MQMADPTDFQPLYDFVENQKSVLISLEKNLIEYNVEDLNISAQYNNLVHAFNHLQNTIERSDSLTEDLRQAGLNCMQQFRDLFQNIIQNSDLPIESLSELQRSTEKFTTKLHKHLKSIPVELKSVNDLARKREINNDKGKNEKRNMLSSNTEIRDILTRLKRLEANNKDLKSELEKEKKGLITGCKDEVSEYLESQYEGTRQQIVELIKENDTFGTSIQRNKENLEKHIKSTNSEIESYKNQKQDELNNYIEASKREQQLKEPIRFWEENKDFHSRRSYVYGIAALFSIVVTMIFLALSATSVVGEEQTFASINWTKFGLVVFFTSLAIWVTRILVRLYLSHNHLELSSQEKIVMSKAYLAFIAEGGATTSEQQQLVLQAIFKPNATGIVSDDAAPPTLLEIVNQLAKLRK